ncbi:phage tail tube protein [Glutamicibacter arilaitensis]|uniref:phage tail tube protein n=1 Tax=Glutamicibacter arilaitensis TaxID=256701 RepID=UPI003FD0E8BB
MTTTADVLIGAPERSTEEGVVGYAYTLPRSAALPTDTTTALPPTAEDLGFVSEDGLAISTDRSVEPIRDWNLDDVRLLLTEHSATITFTIISWTVAGLKAYFGDENVSETDEEIVVKINGRDIASRAWVFNLKDLDRKRRVVVPNGAISSQGEITFVKGENTPLEIELTALVDDLGEKIYIYTAKEATDPVV